MLADSGFKIQFHTPNGLHVRNISPLVAQSLFTIGVKTLRLSFESNTQKIQALSGAKTSNQDLVHARDNLRSVGYSGSDIEVYLMVGLPTQTKDDVIHAMDFVHRNGLAIKLALFSPIPRTPEFIKAQEKYPSISGDPLFHNNTVFTHNAADMSSWLSDIKLRAQEYNARLT
jgi:radical SAM superfamily enzyme YgiQ (UPF0313 family)